MSLWGEGGGRKIPPPQDIYLQDIFIHMLLKENGKFTMSSTILLKRLNSWQTITVKHNKQFIIKIPKFYTIMLHVSATPRIKYNNFQQMEHNSSHTQANVLLLLLIHLNIKSLGQCRIF